MGALEPVNFAIWGQSKNCRNFYSDPKFLGGIYGYVGAERMDSHNQGLRANYRTSAH